MVWLAPGKRQVVAVESAQPDGIEFLVVFLDEPFPSFVILPNPFLEAVFDFLLLFPRRLGGVRVDDLFVRFAVANLVVNGRRPQIQRIFNQFQSRWPDWFPNRSCWRR